MTYADLIAQLLPVPYDRSSLSGELAAEGLALTAVQTSAAALQDEFWPETTTRLIDRWEAWMGLPCCCDTSPDDLSLSARQDRLARAVYTPGETRTLSYFRDVLDRAGFWDVTVREVADPYVLQVAVPDTASITSFAAGTGAAGQPLRSWAAHPVECVIGRAVQAHIRYAIAWGAVVDLNELVGPEMDRLHELVHVVYPQHFGV